jgi:hypothetical protein
MYVITSSCCVTVILRAMNLAWVQDTNWEVRSQAKRLPWKDGTTYVSGPYSEFDIRLNGNDHPEGVNVDEQTTRALKNYSGGQVHILARRPDDVM